MTVLSSHLRYWVTLWYVYEASRALEKIASFGTLEAEEHHIYEGNIGTYLTGTI